jgi:hypothetical protein
MIARAVSPGRQYSHKLLIGLDTGGIRPLIGLDTVGIRQLQILVVTSRAVVGGIHEYTTYTHSFYILYVNDGFIVDK